MDKDNGTAYKLYSYRWVILLLYIVVASVIQLMWATFFSVTTAAWRFYGFQDPVAGENAIGLLSIIFMVGMIALSVPSLAAFEKFGYKKSVGFGAVLTGISALIRGFWADSYQMVVICTVLFAIAQPFLLNAVGMVAGKWFPENERATANGLAVMSNYIGMMIGLLMTPLLLEGGMGFKQMLILYGVIAMAAAVLFMVFTKEAPPTPPCAEEDSQRSSFTDGVKSLFKKRDFILSALVFFCAMGVFNTFFTLIEPIIRQLSGGQIDSTATGLLGVIVLGVGILGSVIVPVLSDKDKYRRRKPYMLAANLIGAAGFGSFMLMKGFGGMALAAVLYGLFSIGSTPVLMTYCAEIAYPTSEGTSEGLLMFVGNIGGVVFLGIISLMGGNHYMAMGLMFGILVACLALILAMKEKKKV